MNEPKKNNRLKEVRLKKGYTLAELSKKVGVSDATLQRYESGRIQNIKMQILQKLAEVLECSESYIMGLGEPDIRNIIPYSPVELPVLGKIACGEPIICNDESGTFATVVSGNNADFCLIARGDSMIGSRIYDGDIVMVKAQNDVENGEIAAVIIDNEATLKKVYKKGGVITLMAANPKYDPLVYTPEDFKQIRIIGKAIGMQTNNLYIEN